MAVETDLPVRPLAKSDDRSGFCSGNIDLDRFFQRYAGQNQFRHHIGTTYVALSGSRIRGFVTVSPGELTAESVKKATLSNLPDYPLPILRISRLAVDQRDQGKGIGKLLLRSMFSLALDLRERVGCIGVVVDAKPEAGGFYQDLGFVELDTVSGTLGDRPEPIPMFLPIKKIQRSIGE